MKTRFAPSPTGSLHIGNVRTALFSALYAKKHQGLFLLRIEDTDKERSEEKFTQELLENLAWFKLEFQEGPGKDLGNGPYFQSQRQDIYKRYYEMLQKTDVIYPCFCTENELNIMRKTQLAAGKPPRYLGKCASLSEAEIKAKLKAGLKPVLRFRIPKNEIIEFNDLVKGPQRFNTDDIGDFIVRRGDGSSPFMFCNAIDDALMGVTHVIRGEDHVTNTTRQIMILKALNLPVPIYGHISLILGFDGSPLSKRHGSSSTDDFRKMGIFPEALMNYLARLGHYYEENTFMTFNELAEKFKEESLSKSPAKFDPKQLEFWQREAFNHLNKEEIWEWMGEQVHQLVPKDSKSLFMQAITHNILTPKEAFHWANILFGTMPKLDDEKVAVLKNAGELFFESALRVLKSSGDQFQPFNQQLQTELNIKGKPLFMPLRIALTGEEHGPEMINIFKLLGIKNLESRLQMAKNLSASQSC